MNNQLAYKILSVFAYTFPLNSALDFSAYLITKFPIIYYIKYLTLPIDFIENIFPLEGLFFLLLFLAVGKNSNFPYFLRFNALQAILCHIILIITKYLLIIFSQIIGNNFFLEILLNLVSITSLTTIIFCLFKSAQGNHPELPKISNAVRMHI